jgi:hypothetical protein
MDDKFEFYLIDALKEFADKIRECGYTDDDRRTYRELFGEYIATLTEYEVVHKGEGRGR